jgi:hypothetical protein
LHSQGHFPIVWDDVGSLIILASCRTEKGQILAVQAGCSVPAFFYEAAGMLRPGKRVA